MKKDKGAYDKVCGYVNPYLSKYMNVLELACGSGKLSFNLSKYTKSWIATDFSKQMIFEARKHGEYENLVFEIADATSLIYTDEKFDCVVIANTLHIMSEPDKAMKEIYRVLKPNGTLFAPIFLWKEEKQSKFKKRLMSIVICTLFTGHESVTVRRVLSCAMIMNSRRCVSTCIDRGNGQRHRRVITIRVTFTP